MPPGVISLGKVKGECASFSLVAVCSSRTFLNARGVRIRRASLIFGPCPLWEGPLAAARCRQMPASEIAPQKE
jgi:hypothetical protein